MTGKRCRSGGATSPKPLPKVYDGPNCTARHRALLLDLIHGFYEAALARLPLEEMPELAPQLLEAGLCFGFMDPVSNIVVNTLSFGQGAAGGDGQAEAGGERKKGNRSGERKSRRQSAKECRKVALSRIVTDISNVSPSDPDPALLPTMSVAVRSLQSLVSFLVCSFRYLFTATALEYLLLAKADLLTAVQLIQQDRNSEAFKVASPVVKVALSCAALTGCHPKPDVLVTEWQTIYLHLDLFSNAVAAEGIIPCTKITDMYTLLKNPPQEPTHQMHPLSPLRLATEVDVKKPRVIGPRIMRSILLDRIHGFYIDALARLPADGLQRRHHRSFLKAGHCYGPMEDPVSNIILNTIWYAKVFPAEEEFEADAILSSSLIRIACRSLYGLVAFIHARFDALSDRDVLWYLLLANANLGRAVISLEQEGHTLIGDPRKAYKAAAKAGWHPIPDAQVEFAVSTVLPKDHSLLLQAVGTLSSGDVERISQLLPVQPSASVGSLKPVPALSKRASRMLSVMKEELEAEGSSMRRKVEAALKKCALLGPEYELHAICGVNMNVVHTGSFKMHRSWLRKCPVLYQYCHLNFLARRKGSHSAGEVPTLFFMECTIHEDKNDELATDKNDELACWPVAMVSTDAGRCVYCEMYGAKIVHPASENYHGWDADFENMVLGEHPSWWTSDDIVRDGISANDSVGILEEDCIYFDPLRDAKYAKHLNREAKDGGGRPRLCC